MGALNFVVFTLFPTVFKVLISRIKNGGKPLLPPWTFKFEIFMMIIQSGMRSRNPSGPTTLKGVERLRTMMDKHAAKVPTKYCQVKDIEIPSPHNNSIHAQWITPHNIENEERVILYLHGGGYIVGSCKSHGYLVSRIATATKTKVLLIEYRLAPEFKFPAPLEDSLVAYEWLQSKEGGSHLPQNVVLMGDSAGGNLSFITSLYLRDNSMKMPKAIVALSPWLDISGSNATWKDNSKWDYLPLATENPNHDHFLPSDITAKDPRVSPFFAELHDLPPILIQVSDREQLYDDSRLIVEKAKSFQNNKFVLEVYNDYPHVFQAFVQILPEVAVAFENINRFLETVFTEKPNTVSETESVLLKSNL